MKIFKDYKTFTNEQATSFVNLNSINESYTNQDAYYKIRFSITRILTKFGFFAQLLMNLKIKEHTNLPHKTMATDGNSIYYDPDFVMKITNQQVLFVLCHELLHNSMFHFIRAKNFTNIDHSIWNQACDYAINPILNDYFKSNTENGKPIGAPLEGILLDEKYNGWSAEVIYDYLLKNPNKQAKSFQNIGDIMKAGEGQGGTDIYDDGSGDQEGEDGQGGGQGEESDEEGKEGKEGKGDGSGEGQETDKEGEGSGEGDGKEGKDGNPKPIKISKNKKDIKDEQGMREKWAKANKEAASRHQGSGAGLLDRYIKTFMKPQVNWKQALKRFIATAINNKIKYEMPYKRFIHSGTYIHGIRKDINAFDNAVIIVDTSGSIDDKILAVFGTEIKSLYSLLHILTMYAISCDAEVNRVDIYKDVRKLELKKFVGGGGTDFKPPFKWIEKNLLKVNKNPAFIIYFTDGFGDFPKDFKFKDRVLWVITDDENENIKIPFGHRLDIKTSDFHRN